MKHEEYKIKKLVKLKDVFEFILLENNLELDSSNG